jgi:hypothetical protein
MDHLLLTDSDGFRTRCTGYDTVDAGERLNMGSN